jgi:hypothetical protein
MIVLRNSRSHLRNRPGSTAFFCSTHLHFWFKQLAIKFRMTMKAIRNHFECPGRVENQRAATGNPDHPIKGVCLLMLVSMFLYGCSSNRSTTDKYSLVPTVAETLSTEETSPPRAEIPAAKAEPAPAAADDSSKPGAIFPPGWQPLFDGSSLKGWKVTDFGGHGEVTVEDSQMFIHLGAMLTGASWTNEFPKSDYEVELEARKVEGGDFFAGVTFPVGDSFCTFIVGGWGGGVVGLSSIDGMDASENETTRYMSFPKDRWFRLKLRVTRAKIETWIDDEQTAEVTLAGRRISLRPGDIYLSQPFGIATWQTTGAIRNIRLQLLSPAPAKAAR